MTGYKKTLVDAFRRESLSFLQYVRQATPYASAIDRPMLERIREMAQAELAEIEMLVDYLDRSRVTLPHLGAFPSEFTNYNFVAIRKLIPLLVTDEARGLEALDRDVSCLIPGEARQRMEKLTEAKRMHLSDLQKLAT